MNFEEALSILKENSDSKMTRDKNGNHIITLNDGTIIEGIQPPPDSDIDKIQASPDDELDSDKATNKYQVEVNKILREAYIKAADIEADARLENHEFRGQLGFCHIFWGLKKRILHDKYHIDWKTPPEENPNCMYDQSAY